MTRPSRPPWASLRTLLLTGTVGTVAAVGAGAIIAARIGPEIEPVTVAPAPVEPVVVPVPVVEAVVAPLAVAPVTTPTSHDCDSTLAASCSGTRGDWTTTVLPWCESQKAAWIAAGVSAVNPCANYKYAKDSCVEWAVATGKATPECAAYTGAMNAANEAFNAACNPTTKAGGVCAGVTPKPSDPTSSVKVVPVDDCVAAHLDTVPAECRAAYEAKVALQPTR